MDDPEMHDDETILFQTPDVFVKSVPFEAVLTDKRIIFIDRKQDLIPPKEIPLSVVKDAEPGENAIRDPTLILRVSTGRGEKRQMVLTFPRYGGGGRNRERDDWVRALKKLKSSPVSNVLSALGRDQKKKVVADTPPPAPPEYSPALRKPPAREGRATVPIEKLSDRQDIPREPAQEALPPYGSFCTKCGNRLMQGSVFCNRCGTKVVTPVQEADVPDRNLPQFAAEETVRPRAAVPQTAVRPQAQKPGHERVFGRSGPQGAGRKGFLSWLFPAKTPRAKNHPAPAPEPRPRSRPAARKPPSGNRKKILMTVGIVVLVLVVAAVGAFVAMNILGNATESPASEGQTESSSGGTGTGSSTVATTATTSASTTAVVVHTTAAPTIPSDGVYVNVSYIGAWKGTYGISGSTTSVARSGTAILEIEDAKGTVEATFQKNDASTKPWVLSVQIYKDGSLLKSGTTTDPQGQVSVTANVGS